MFKKGINFVFADQDDQFFRGSGLIMNYRDYMTLLLGEAGIERKNVWFQTGERMFTSAAGITVEKKDGIFAGNAVDQISDQIGRWLKEDGSAVLMELKDFCLLYGEGLNADKRRKTLKAKLDGCQGMLILHSGLNAAESQPLLVKEDGPAAEICPQITTARKSGFENFFEALGIQLGIGERMIILNSDALQLGQANDQIRNELEQLLTCVELGVNDFSLSDEERVSMENLLYCLVRSVTMRKQLRFNEKDTSFRAIYDRLVHQDKCWEGLVSLMREYREDEGCDLKTLREYYPDMVEWKGGLLLEDDTGRNADSMKLPDWFPDFLRNDAEQMLIEVRSQLHIPRCSPRSAAVMKWIDYYIGAFNHEAGDDDRRDEEYLSASLRVLKFAVRHICAAGEQEQKLDEFFEEYSELVLKKLQVVCDINRRMIIYEARHSKPENIDELPPETKLMYTDYYAAKNSVTEASRQLEEEMNNWDTPEIKAKRSAGKSSGSTGTYDPDQIARRVAERRSKLIE